MKIESNNFVSLSAISVQDQQIQSAVIKGTTNAFNNRLNWMLSTSIERGEALRQQAAEAKRRALRNLPELLEQAEQKLTENGIQVLWANDAQVAHQLILDIIADHEIKSVVKSKSMVTEEIALNDVLQEAQIEVVETDLGEFIIQLNNEHPSHIVAPVVHKTKESIRDIFIEKLGMDSTDSAEEMVGFARQILREKFVQADMGISGGNFIIAETGSIGLVMNEGNGRMVTTLPKVHVAVVGIEKIVETTEDYAILTQVLSRSGTGQSLTVYTNIIHSPAKSTDEDGPEHVYVIFLDNGRSDIYASKYTEALACIRCGACLNACPVYRSTGGNAYGWVYGGPIGAVITPLLKGLEYANPLPYASSLCGSCKQVCPVDIDLPRMLLDLRHDLVEIGETEKKYDFGMKVWERFHQSPRLFGWGGKAARIGVQMHLDETVPNPLSEWKKHRDFPGFAKKPFRELWKERNKNE
jgi:L-lactate dehydrogenase complex protein LldF